MGLALFDDDADCDGEDSNDGNNNDSSAHMTISFPDLCLIALGLCSGSAMSPAPFYDNANGNGENSDDGNNDSSGHFSASFPA